LASANKVLSPSFKRFFSRKRHQRTLIVRRIKARQIKKALSKLEKRKIKALRAKKKRLLTKLRRAQKYLRRVRSTRVSVQTKRKTSTKKKYKKQKKTPPLKLGLYNKLKRTYIKRRKYLGSRTAKSSNEVLARPTLNRLILGKELGILLHKNISVKLKNVFTYLIQKRRIKKRHWAKHL